MVASKRIQISNKKGKIMTIKNEGQDHLDNLYQDYWVFHSKKLIEYEPLELAAVILAQSLSIYRTVLDDNEYNKMIDSISNMRNDVKKLLPEQGVFH
jgi:hypothetical protein